MRTASWGRDSMPPPASESRERRGCALGIASVLFPGWNLLEQQCCYLTVSVCVPGEDILMRKGRAERMALGQGLS